MVRTNYHAVGVVEFRLLYCGFQTLFWRYKNDFLVLI